MKERKKPTITRRQSIGLIAGGASFLATQSILTLPAQEADRQLIAIDPTPRFELSPYLYMQFMEPLGATAADFCGTRWQNNAVIIPVPKNQGRAYLQPVARVMRLYRRHIGSHAVEVKRTPEGLDIVASRSGDTVYLHVVNTQRTRAVKAGFQIEGRRVQSGRVLEMTDDPMVEVTYLNSAEVMRVVEKPIGDLAGWEFPAASVSAVELKLI